MPAGVSWWNERCGALLAEMRGSANLTIEALVKEVGITKKTYRRWVRNEYKPSQSKLEVLMRVLGTQEDAFRQLAEGHIGTLNTPSSDTLRVTPYANEISLAYGGLWGELRMCWQEFLQSVLLTDRDVDYRKALKDWIYEVKCLQEVHGSITLSTYQLQSIYTLASFVCDRKAVIEGSQEHFSSEDWDIILFPDAKCKNHLDQANQLISQSVHEALNDRPGSVSIVELGCGLLATFYQVASVLEGRRIKYAGFEVSPRYAKVASALLKGRFESKEMLRGRKGLKAAFGKATGDYELYGKLAGLSIDQINNLISKDVRIFPFYGMMIEPLWSDQYIQRENMVALDARARSEEESVDIILASYCLHHIPSCRRLLSAIRDGSAVALFGSNLELWPTIVREALYSFAQTTSREAVDDLVVRALDNGSTQELETHLTNDRRKVFESAARLLKRGGLVCIADPDGFSHSFNGERIGDTTGFGWSHSIAHFSDLRDDLMLLHSVGGFELYAAHWQVKLNASETIGIELTEEEIFDDEALKDRLAPYWDPHMGYVLVAQKK